MTKYILLTAIFLITTFFSGAQITNPNTTNPDDVEAEVKKKKKFKSKKVKNDSIAKSTFYLTAGYVNSFRQFEDKSPFGSYSERITETPINTYGVGFGTYINLAKNLDLELGVSYVLQGEQYNYSDSLTDSTFHYTKRYRHFGIPLRLKYNFGKNNLKAFVYGGIIPSSILSYKYESNYTSAEGKTNENDTESKTNTLASFNVTTSVGFGITYELNNIGFMVMPEYRYNLLNTFDGDFIKHNLWSWGVNFGLIFKI
jgi:hypothetical protein